MMKAQLPLALLQVLAQHFEQFGPILAVRLASAVDTLKRKAWIEFADEAAAQSAQSCGDQVGQHCSVNPRAVRCASQLVQQRRCFVITAWQTTNLAEQPVLRNAIHWSLFCCTARRAYSMFVSLVQTCNWHPCTAIWGLRASAFFSCWSVRDARTRFDCCHFARRLTGALNSHAGAGRQRDESAAISHGHPHESASVICTNPGQPSAHDEPHHLPILLRFPKAASSLVAMHLHG